MRAEYKKKTGAYRAFSHSAVLPPVFCHGVDIDVAVVRPNGQEVTVWNVKIKMLILLLTVFCGEF